MIRQLIYVSEAQKSLTKLDLNAIIEVAAKNNEEMGITGILIFENGHFFQLLEGEAVHIDTLLTILRKDTRHNNIQIIYDKFNRSRLASKWAMSYLDLTDPNSDIKKSALVPIEQVLSQLEKTNVDQHDNENIVWQLTKQFIEFRMRLDNEVRS